MKTKYLEIRNKFTEVTDNCKTEIAMHHLSFGQDA
jgi:hypothetical protein